MTFGEILKELESGKVVRRASYDPSFVIYKQLPSCIEPRYVLKMLSVPSDMKLLLVKNESGIKYTNQYIIYDFIEECATYVTFDGDDINASDWEVIDVLSYNPYE